MSGLKQKETIKTQLTQTQFVSLALSQINATKLR